MDPQKDKILLISSGAADPDEIRVLQNAGYNVEIVDSIADIAERLAINPDLKAIIGSKELESVAKEHEKLKKHLREVEESERMYRSFIERSGDGIVVLQDRLIKFVNPKFCEISGYSADTLLNTVFTNYLTPEEIQWAIKRYERRLAGGVVPEPYETAMTRSDGSKIFLELSGALVFFEGRPADLVLARDISARKKVEAALDSERRRLRAVLDALPVAVMITNEKGGFIEWNRQAQEMWGTSIPGVAGIEDYTKFKVWWVETGEPISVKDSAIYRALTRGETSLDEMIEVERADGEHMIIIHSAAPIIGSEGRIVGAVAAQQDVTELVNLRKALERALEEAKRESWRAIALESIAEAGLSTLRLPELLKLLVERIAKALNVDACCVFVLDEAAGEFEAHAEYNVPGLLGCRIKMDEGLIGKVATERQPVYVADAEHDPIAVDSCKIKPVAKSLLGVPLIARDKVVGVTRVQSIVAREFTEDEVCLLREIADRVALAIDNAKLYNSLQRSRHDAEATLEREKQFSLLLQRALLPASPTLREDYAVSVRYVPAFVGREIGGDFYDVFKLNDDLASIMIGDVSGKGLEAASLAATTRSTIHAFVHETKSPGDALTRANTVLSCQQPCIESFVTIFLVILDLASGEMSFVSAGHPPAIVLRANGDTEFLNVINLPIGVADSVIYKQKDNTLDLGDKLILFTDGISEAHGSAGMLELEGVKNCVAGHSDWTCDQISDELIFQATKWSDGEIRDDAAVVVVERLAPKMPSGA